MKICWSSNGRLRTKYLLNFKKISARIPNSIISQRKKHVEVFSEGDYIRKLIVQNTEISDNHMTPELKLHLITPKCKLWWSKGDNSPFCDPYWAFYWSGGQVISRYILDHPSQFLDKCVLDVGAGCGASAIAAAKTGAKTAISNDVDEVAGIAAKMNAKLNDVSVQIDTCNLIGQTGRGWDVVLLGDMFYDASFADTVIQWVTTLMKNNTEILIGDPGRLPLLTHPVKNTLTKVAEYKLPYELARENNGFTTGTVWTIKR
ncbi:electron transfer flavoprotein beta subunit lysine methyltransferase-like [Gigantopelta aegis]|uniref:electron transfer flavoprotein beta subunit lysine methyltransferase-like n=1 Tax=Gigantopelta aegis TaxID=1735272 RepID=UPI001B88A6F7|nr:electron transfer flavoprotein beta subunit lysine methyltransferase-like [Gigantopelta aegis]